MSRTRPLGTPASARLCLARRWCSGSASMLVSTPSVRRPPSSHSVETPAPVPSSTDVAGAGQRGEHAQRGAGGLVDRADADLAGPLAGGEERRVLGLPGRDPGVERRARAAGARPAGGRGWAAARAAGRRQDGTAARRRRGPAGGAGGAGTTASSGATLRGASRPRRARGRPGRAARCAGPGRAGPGAARRRRATGGTGASGPAAGGSPRAAAAGTGASAGRLAGPAGGCGASARGGAPDCGPDSITGLLGSDAGEPSRACPGGSAAGVRAGTRSRTRAVSCSPTASTASRRGGPVTTRALHRRPGSMSRHRLAPCAPGAGEGCERARDGTTPRPARAPRRDGPEPTWGRAVGPADVGRGRDAALGAGLPARLPPHRQQARRRGPHPGGLRPRVPVAVELHARAPSRAGCTGSRRTCSSTPSAARRASASRRCRTTPSASSAVTAAPRRSTTRRTSTTTSRPRSTRCRPTSAPPSCCATSRACRTRRSPTRSASRSARCAAGSTAGAARCAPPSPTGPRSGCRALEHPA